MSDLPGQIEGHNAAEVVENTHALQPNETACRRTLARRTAGGIGDVLAGWRSLSLPASRRSDLNSTTIHQKRLSPASYGPTGHFVSASPSRDLCLATYPLNLKDIAIRQVIPRSDYGLARTLCGIVGVVGSRETTPVSTSRSRRLLRSKPSSDGGFYTGSALGVESSLSVIRLVTVLVHE